MHDPLLRIDGESFFQRFNRAIEPATPLVAPAQREPSLDHARIGRDRGLERHDRLSVSFGGSQSLATQQVQLRPGSITLGQSIEHIERTLGQTLATRSRGHPFLKQADQIEITFGFPKNLLTAYSLDCNHGGVLHDALLETPPAS